MMLKMKNFEELSENSYRLTVYYGYKPNGQQNRRRRTFKWSKEKLTDNQKEKEARANYQEFKKEVESGTCLDKGNITFERFTQIWLTDYATIKLAPKTVERYKSLLYRINEELGDLKLHRIEPLHIVKLMNRLTNSGMRIDQKYSLKEEYFASIRKNRNKLYEVVNERTVANILKGGVTNGQTAIKIADVSKMNISELFDVKNPKDKLSQQTLLHHYKLLNSIFNKAIKWRYILLNPVNGANDYCPRVERKEKEFLNNAEISTMFELMEGEPLKYQAAVYIAVLGGLRLGEVIALKWSDIDFDTARLSITKAAQYVSGLGNFEKTPKNDSSKRPVMLPEIALEKLRELQSEQSIEKENLGSQWVDNDNVFTQWNGERIAYGTVSHWFAKWIAATDLPKVTFHGLRHSHASLLIANGEDIARVSKRLGHSRISTTLDIYTHADNKKDTDMVKTLDDMFT